MKLFIRTMIQQIRYYFYKIRYIFIKPKYPSNQDNKVLIHLGCGEIDSPGYINIDSRPFAHVHNVHDVCDLPFLGNNFADLIYSSHTLEHVSYIKLAKVIREWRRILKKGGVLRIGVPDFDAILNIYRDNNNSIEVILPSLMGGQDYKQNFHYSVFNKKYLTSLLLECGFTEVRDWDPKKVDNHTFEDWTSSIYEVNGKVYHISLNLEAIK